ncbi:MAG: hypothetical protein RLQ25_02915, partial [Alphaproteobacteria bacterium]
LVPICTFHGGADSTVIVDQKTRGLSLTRKSYIAYYAAKKVPRKATIRRIEGKELTASGPIPKELLDEINAGVFHPRLDLAHATLVDLEPSSDVVLRQPKIEQVFDPCRHIRCHNRRTTAARKWEDNFLRHTRVSF